MFIRYLKGSKWLTGQPIEKGENTIYNKMLGITMLQNQGLTNPPSTGIVVPVT
jgi:hypothetical protein